MGLYGQFSKLRCSLCLASVRALHGGPGRVLMLDQVQFVLTAFLVVVLLMFVMLAKVLLLLLVLFISVFMVMFLFV